MELLLLMAREGLRRVLAMALRKVVAQQTLARYPDLQVRTNGDFATVNLTVRPLAASDGGAAPGMFLISLEEAPPPALPASEEVEGGIAADGEVQGAARVTALEQELHAKEEYLQTTLEEMETANEELKSTNEELQSVNEELQSTNEELETSKEELQSVNEELATVNAELQQKVAELMQANNDMNNLLAGTGVGTIFVDHQLRIRRFTPAATQLINLIQTDVGRPVSHIVVNLVGYDRLVADVQAVLDSLTPKEVEVQTRAGDWYLLRIRPYRTLENVIEGAVITFVDITRMKKIEAMQRLAAVVRDAYDAITVQDLEGHILAWNPAAERIYGWSETEALGMNIREMIPEGQRAEALAVVQQLGRAEVLAPYHAQRLAKDGRIVEVWLTATALLAAHEGGHVYAIATTARKIDSAK